MPSQWKSMSSSALWWLATDPPRMTRTCPTSAVLLRLFVGGNDEARRLILHTQGDAVIDAKLAEALCPEHLAPIDALAILTLELESDDNEILEQ